MTQEERDRALIDEAVRRLIESGNAWCSDDLAKGALALEREGWEQPTPSDPALVIAREVAKENNPPEYAEEILAGKHDETLEMHKLVQAAQRGIEMGREETFASNFELSDALASISASVTPYADAHGLSLDNPEETAAAVKRLSEADHTGAKLHKAAYSLSQAVEEYFDALVGRRPADRKHVMARQLELAAILKARKL